MSAEPESLTSNDELQDTSEQARFELGRLDPKLLTGPVVVRAVVGIAIAALILAWPERSNTVLARLIGLGILKVSATSVRAALRSDPTRWLNMATGCAGIALAAGLLLVPDQPESALSRLIGVALLAVALRDLWQNRRRARSEHQTWILWRSMAVLATGLLLVALPDQIFSLATTLLALAWIALSIVVIVATLDPSTEGAADYAETTRLLADWLDRRQPLKAIAPARSTAVETT